VNIVLLSVYDKNIAIMKLSVKNNGLRENFNIYIVVALQTNYSS